MTRSEEKKQTQNLELYVFFGNFLKLQKAFSKTRGELKKQIPRKPFQK